MPPHAVALALRGAYPISMPITRDQELWGIALWVEKNHGHDGWLHIAQQQDRLLAFGDFKGMAMWREVGRRYDQLQEEQQSN